MSYAEGRWRGCYPASGVELRRIERYARLAGKRVLEIGAGNGRLTFQYGSRAARVLALDPEPSAVAEGNAAARQLPHVRFVRARAEAYRPPPRSFDVVFVTWAL